MKRVVIGATSLALALLCARGLFVRWIADDFWTAAAVKTHGFFGAQAWWYRVWSGRFVFTFVSTLIQTLGPRVAGILVTLVVIALLVVAARFTNVPLAFAVVYSVLLGTVDVPQSVLWQTGLLTYVVPLILPVIGAGFSEIGALAQIVAFAIWRKWWLMAATIAVAAIVALAPGNAVRRSLYPAAVDVVPRTVASTAMFFVDELSRSGAALVLVFVTAALFPAWRVDLRSGVGRPPGLRPRTASGSGTPDRRGTGGPLPFCAATVAVALAANAACYATLSQPPPSRALVVPHAFFVAAVAAAGASIRVSERCRKPLMMVLVLACIGGPVVDAWQTARSIPPARRFAMAWDTLDAQLRSSKGRDVVVDGAPGMAGTLLFITHDPANRMNPAMAAYYGLRSLAAAPVSRGRGPQPRQDLFVNSAEGAGGHDQHDVVRLRFAADRPGD